MGEPTTPDPSDASGDPHDPEYPLDDPADDPLPEPSRPPEPRDRDRRRALVRADLEGQDLRESKLAGADLTEANLRGADLRGVDLRDARLVDACLEGADLRDAVLDGADLASASLVDVAANGLRAAGAHLELADLRRADLRFADLSRAHLTDASLTDARLEHAFLTDADLIGAQLGGTSLRSAVLHGANLRDAYLERTDFHGSRFGFTVVAASSLTGARGLEAVRHDGPSTIGIDAFLLSRGEIPDAFLVGTGLTPLTVAYLKSIAAAEEGTLVGRSVFLLFAARDRDRARRIRAYLRMHGHAAWYFRETDTLVTAHNRERRERVRFDERLVVLDSESSRHEPSLLDAVEQALRTEGVEHRRTVWAVRLDPERPTPSDLERRLEGHEAADFCGADWRDPRDATFRRELDRLLAALR